MTEIENTNQKISVSNPSPSHENVHLSHSNGSSSTNSTEGNSSQSFSHRLRNSIHSLSSSFGSLKGKILPKQMRKKKELKMALKVEHEARLEAEEREKKLQTELNSTQQQLLTVTAGKESAELMVSQLEKCSVAAEKMELERRLSDEVAAKENAERSVDLLKTAKEMIAGENERLKNQLAQEELKLGEARIMQTLQSETIRQLQREKANLLQKLEAEQTAKEEAKLKATIAEFQFNELCGKAQRLAEGAAKCVRDVEETKKPKKPYNGSK